jgi:hypothetical protein
MVDNFMAAILVFFLGGLAGWLFAHQEISTECHRQGGFYVGSKDFKCEVVK